MTFGPYLVQASDVFWITDGGSYALSESLREELLATYHEAGCIRPFLDLHQAHVAAGGVPMFNRTEAA